MTASLGGCAGGFRAQHKPRPGARFSLIYYADLLDAQQPDYPIVAATRLGPVTQLGQAPWATGSALLKQPLDPRLRALVSPIHARQQRLGGAAALAACLHGIRQQRPQHSTLTLENGQCWNGAGFSLLTQGRAGPETSQRLGAEIRLSSDERWQWPDQISQHYQAFHGAVIGGPVKSASDSKASDPNASNPETANRHNTSTAHRLKRVSYVERQGVQIAVIGASDPYAPDEKASLEVWFEALQQATQEARQQAHLVVLMADTGAGVAHWLAERLDIDLLLAARSQIFWPEPVQVQSRHGQSVPILFPGSRGVGAWALECHAHPAGWQFEARFHVASPTHWDAITHTQYTRLNPLFEQSYASYHDWLQQPIAVTPQWLWRQDATGGSWDGLILAALRAQGQTAGALAPGLRYDRWLAPGQTITRDHLLSLTGGHSAPVVTLNLASPQLTQLLERATDQYVGSPGLLDNGHDLPRLSGAQWHCRYTQQGPRVSIDEAPSDWTSFNLHGRQGMPLWQILERYLSELDGAPSSPRWSAPQPALQFVSGHPGWHPQWRPEV